MAELPKIQFEIMFRLYGSDMLRYSKLRPDAVENDLYNYHLQALIKKGFVEKMERSYRLTFAGLEFINKRMPIDLSGNHPDLFKVNALTFVMRETNGKKELVHQERTSQPFYGDRAVPGGMVRHGERIVDAAKRKAFEECGVEAEFKLAGVIRITFEQEERILQDILYHVCYAENYVGPLIDETKYGKNYWVDVDGAIEDEKHNHAPLPPLLELYGRLKKQNFPTLPFFYADNRVEFH
jgi:ADP-ribose pyrophosphatase YjhB (NUDIX family)